MNKEWNEEISLEAFAKIHGIELSPTADRKSMGYAIHTGGPSLPAFFWVTKESYKNYHEKFDAQENMRHK